MLSTLFGLGALKAHFGGAASGVVALGSILAGACDLTTIGQQVGAVAGAWLFGYVATWISPKNKPTGLW